MSPTDIFLGGAALTLIILLLTPRIHRDVAARKSKEDSKIAESKEREAATSEWRRTFLGIVMPLKIEMMRAQIPSEWYGRFETSIPIMNRLTFAMPDGFDSARSSEIVSIVQWISGMTDTQAVGGCGAIINALSRLEVLCSDAQHSAGGNSPPAQQFDIEVH